MNAPADFHARKEAAAILQESKSLLDDAERTAQLGSFFWDAATNRVTWSEQLYRIYGQDPAHFEPSFEAYLASVHPDDRAQVQERLQQAIDTRGGFAHDYRLQRPDGETRWVHARGRALRNSAGAFSGLQGTCQDISARKQTEEALQASLREKEALLRELHHRVKNNLQVITSLLRLEGRRAASPDTRGTLDALQGRIHSMALLHESLYRHGEFAHVELGSYLGAVARHAFDAQVSGHSGIRLALSLDSLRVGMDQAIACGLFVNELICNSLKHGFAHDASGTVCVTLQASAVAPAWRLGVSDTGVGLPVDFARRRESALGLQLVGDLADQIGGQLEHEAVEGGGVQFSVVFRTLPACQDLRPV